MKKTISQIFILLPLFAICQSDFCDKSFDDSYWPLEIGFEKTLTWGKAIYAERINKTVEQNGLTYYLFEQDFGEGTSYDIMLRKQNDTIYLYNEEKKKDVILLIERAEKGLKWDTGKVIETNGFFETPYCNYNNLLVIENKYDNGTKEKRFYKKGLGLVAVTEKGGIKGMCVPNKEETKALSKPLSAYECIDKNSKEEIANCTRTYIHSYLIGELKKHNLKTPKEEGILNFKLQFDKDGKIEEIKSLNSIKGGNQAKKIIIDILYTLPKFRPTMTSATKSVRTSMELSIPIKTP